MTFLYFLVRLYCLSGILSYYQYTHCFEFTFSSAITIFTLDFALCASYRRDGVVVRVSASQSVDLGFIPLVESYQKTSKMVSIASLLGAWHLWKVVENKPASSLVVSLGKALNETPHLYVEDR